MRVRIDIGLDFDGMHTFEWEASEAPGAVDVPRATLERWAMERETFKRAFLRWKSVAEEVEELLYRAEQRRISHRHAGTNPAQIGVDVAADVAVAVVAAAPLPASRR